MRTTLNLDEAALKEAMALGEGRTKTAVINEAVRDWVSRRRLRGLLDLEGTFHWEGNLDRLRKRKTLRR